MSFWKLKGIPVSVGPEPTIFHFTLYNCGLCGCICQKDVRWFSFDRYVGIEPYNMVSTMGGFLNRLHSIIKSPCWYQVCANITSISPRVKRPSSDPKDCAWETWRTPCLPWRWKPPRERPSGARVWGWRLLHSSWICLQR